MGQSPGCAAVDDGTSVPSRSLGDEAFESAAQEVSVPRGRPVPMNPVVATPRDRRHACCLDSSARKGNRRHGPALPRHLRRRPDGNTGIDTQSGYDSEGSMAGLSADLMPLRKCLSFDPDLRRVSRTANHVRWMARVSHHDLLESGNDWALARMSDDIDLSRLPSEQESVKSRPSWNDAGGATSAASARQRAAGRRNRSLTGAAAAPQFDERDEVQHDEEHDEALVMPAPAVAVDGPT